MSAMCDLKQPWLNYPVPLQALEGINKLFPQELFCDRYAASLIRTLPCLILRGVIRGALFGVRRKIFAGYSLCTVVKIPGIFWLFCSREGFLGRIVSINHSSICRNFCWGWEIIFKKDFQTQCTIYFAIFL